tara:strand:- start:224 stop:802 length:579 start_codon:yes stop_codon:yes gene_type:complete
MKQLITLPRLFSLGFFVSSNTDYKVIDDCMVDEKIKFVVCDDLIDLWVHNILLKEYLEVDYNNSYKTNVKAKMTKWDTKTRGISLLSEIVVNRLIFEYRDHGYNLQSNNCWFAKYDMGEYTSSHNHIPSVFSFVYFLKSPTGSSPLVFTNSNMEIEPKEGRLVMFPSILYHHVPPNNCNDRVVLAGNINWIP